MSEATGTRIKVALFLPPAAQYSKGDGVFFEGDTVAEVHALLQDALSFGLLTKAVEAAKVYLVESGLGEHSKPVAAVSGDNVVPFQQPTQSAAPAPMCQHGKRTWKAGPNGKWYAWFCPAPKGAPDQCSPIWANADGTAKD